MELYSKAIWLLFNARWKSAHSLLGVLCLVATANLPTRLTVIKFNFPFPRNWAHKSLSTTTTTFEANFVCCGSFLVYFPCLYRKPHTEANICNRRHHHHYNASSDPWESPRTGIYGCFPGVLMNSNHRRLVFSMPHNQPVFAWLKMKTIFSLR